jgi:hypothetical protein
MLQPFCAQGKNPGTYLKESWVVPRTSAAFFKKEKNLLLLPGIKSQTIHYTLAIPKVTLRNYIKSEPIKM